MAVAHSTVSFNESELAAAELVSAIDDQQINPRLKEIWKTKEKMIKTKNNKWSSVRKAKSRVKHRDSAMYKLSVYNKKANLKRDEINRKKKSENEEKKIGFIQKKSAVVIPKPLTDVEYQNINPSVISKRLVEEKKKKKIEKKSEAKRIKLEEQSQKKMKKIKGKEYDFKILFTFFRAEIVRKCSFASCSTGAFFFG